MSTISKPVRCAGACLLAALMAGLTGCASRGETAEEVRYRHKEVIRHDVLLLQNDLDTLFLLDRPTRLTIYNVE